MLSSAIRENGASSGPGVLASYAYDNLGRRTSVTRGNGVVTAYDFDAASRLTELDHDLASTASDVSFDFEHDAAGGIVERLSDNASYNWTPASPGTTSYANNNLNQYTSVGGTSQSYDARGNLTTGSLGYDIYNRLVSGPSSATLAYDPVGRLYQTVGGGVTTRFLYSGAQMIAEYNGSDTLQRRFVPGPGLDEPIVQYEGTTLTDRRWLLQDERGSVIVVTDGSGAASTINTYDEYGLRGSSNAGRFQYTGQAWLPEVSLYHYKARAYSPTLGRFLQTDPVLFAGGINLYAYVANDPVNFIDPSGLWGWMLTVCRITQREGPNGHWYDSVSCERQWSWGLTPPLPGTWQAELRTWNDVPVATMSDLCSVPSVSLGGSMDAYAGLGGSVGSGIGFNPATGQGFLAFDVGVGVGIGTAGRVTEGTNVSASPSGGPRPIVELGLNLNATGAVGPVGATGSYQLLGSSPGDWSAGATQAMGATANVNVSGHGQVNTPALWDAGCSTPATSSGG